MCLLGGDFIECVTQIFELVYSFYFPFFPVPLILFIFPLSLIEHHHFRLLNIHFQLFLPDILSQFFIISLIFISLFTTITKSGSKLSLYLPHYRPSSLVLSLTFHPYIINESTTFERATNERATKESRNMSAATKERHDKRAPRQKSAATKERRDKIA
jgi:hypothetical protein